MFIQNKGIVTMAVELLDTEEAQADDPLDVQVSTPLCTQGCTFKCCSSNNGFIILASIPCFTFSACQATWSSLLEQSPVCVLKRRVTSSNLFFCPGKKLEERLEKKNIKIDLRKAK